MRTAISSDVSISYHLSGRGQTLVFLHPFPMDHRIWQAQIDYFSANYQVLAVDLRGFGNSDGFGKDSPSIERMADDVADLLDALQIRQKIILCGLSIGGYVALRFAEKYFSALRGLVICDSRAQADSAETKLNRNKMMEFMREHSPAELVEKVRAGVLGKTSLRTHPELLNRIREIGKSQSRQGILDAIIALRERPDATEWLKNITIPTLLIFGEEDVLAPSHVVQTLDGKLPDSTLIRLPQAGHFSNLEQPELFNAALEDYLRHLENAY